MKTMTKNMIAVLGSMTALALTAAPASATVIPVGTSGNPYFNILDAEPDFSTIDATFGASIKGSKTAVTTFDDVFTFTLPLSGIGSGSVSTSSSGPGTQLTITKVIINGVPESVTDAAYPGISGVPITAFQLNTIEIEGTVAKGAKFGAFSGTATFNATTVPEPVTWATFLVGFGFIGMAVRRKLSGAMKIA